MANKVYDGHVGYAPPRRIYKTVRFNNKKMKIIQILIGFTVLIFASCEKQSQVNNSIQNVEKRLLPEVLIKGDTTHWSIVDRMKYYNIPGISIAIINDYKIDWAKGYGIYNTSGDSVNTDTYFQAGSISKFITSGLITKMSEKYSFDLETDINQYLKNWQLPENKKFSPNKVNMKNLLSHSGGISVTGFPGYISGGYIPNLKEILVGSENVLSDSIKVINSPNEKFQYSGGGYAILQQSITDITNESFNNLMQRFVFDTLEMDQSTFEIYTDSTNKSNISNGFHKDGSSVINGHLLYPESAAAGLWSTPTDLAKFIIDFQLAVKDDSGKFFTKQNAELISMKHIKTLTNDMGLGIFIETRNNEQYLMHNGFTEGFRSIIYFNKYNGYGAVIMTNSYNAEKIRFEILRSIAKEYDWKEYLPIEKEIVSISKVNLTEVLGTYDFGNGFFIKILKENDRIYSQAVGQDKVEAFPESELSFFHKEIDAAFTIILKDDNQPSEIIWNQSGAKFKGVKEEK